MFDVITMTAVLEHLPPQDQAGLADIADRHLRPGGHVVITVPSAPVDGILAVLMRLGLVGGMAVEEHWGFDPADTPRLFPPPRFQLVERKVFQLGLNNLFVFQRVAPADH